MINIKIIKRITKYFAVFMVGYTATVICLSLENANSFELLDYVVVFFIGIAILTIIIIFDVKVKKVNTILFLTEHN